MTMQCRATMVACFSALLWISGCKKDKLQPAEPPAEVTTEAPAPQPAPQVVAADPSKDHTSTPDWLPAPDELPGWLRTTNVQVRFAGDWGPLPGKALQDFLNAYRIRSLASFEYHSVEPITQPLSVGVHLFEAYGSDDAYGLFTSVMSSAVDRRIGSLSGVPRGTPGDRICWQNQYFVYATGTEVETDADRAAVGRLIAGLVEPIPSGKPPALIEFLPTAGRNPDRIWVVRKHLNALPAQIREGVLHGQTVPTTQALGLNMDTLMVVAALEVAAEKDHPNVVWLVQYPTPNAARRAYQDYSGWRERQTPAPLISIEKPVGPYLVGSWTLDQESLQPVVPEILSKLPK